MGSPEVARRSSEVTRVLRDGLALPRGKTIIIPRGNVEACRRHPIHLTSPVSQPGCLRYDSKLILNPIGLGWTFVFPLPTSLPHVWALQTRSIEPSNTVNEAEMGIANRVNGAGSSAARIRVNAITPFIKSGVILFFGEQAQKSPTCSRTIECDK